MHTLTLGPLNCRVIGNPATARLTFMLNHGYGAPGSDLVPLASEFNSVASSLVDQVAYVFPEAPLSLEELGMPGGRAWWPINMQKLQQILQTNNLDELTKAEPPGMATARQMYLEFLDLFQKNFSLKTDQLVLGGFSQGAMLATDISLRLPEAPRALCIYSGTLLCEEIWQKLAKQRTSLPVLQLHGMQDQILPYEGAVRLRKLLEGAGLKVDFRSFAGMHTIPYEALQLTVDLLKTALQTTDD